MEKPIFQFLNLIFDVVALGLIWLLFSIPIITIGASTTALFYVTTRRISDREGYLFKDFLSSFTANIKKATLLWLLWLILVAIILANIYVLVYLGLYPTMVAILLPLQICVLIELYFTLLYLFPLTARFEMGFAETIKTAFIMANKHILATLSCIGTAIVVTVVCLAFPPLFVVAMGAYAFITSHRFMQVFKKYRPEIDLDF